MARLHRTKGHRSVSLGSMRMGSPLARCVLFLCFLWPAYPAPALEAANPCYRWAKIAAREADVPEDLLRAIAMTESGTSRWGSPAPWPWTVNSREGGRWFPDMRSALSYAEQQRLLGVRNVDIGCFQINFHWHGHAFDSLEAMMDPARNSRYAARLLRRLFRETGSWEAASRAYHSRTESHADRYWGKLSKNLAGSFGKAVAPSTAPEREEKRENRTDVVLAARFPLAGSSAAAGGLGSLVPLEGATAAGSLFRTARKP